MAIGKTQARKRHTDRRRLACLPFVDIFNHTQNVKEQQFTLNDTRRRAVDAACHCLMPHASMPHAPE